MSRSVRIIVLPASILLVLAALAAACGGGGGKKATVLSPTAGGQTTAAPTQAGQPTGTEPAAGAAPFKSYHYKVDLGLTVAEPGKPEQTFISGNVEGDFAAPDSHSFANTFKFGGLSGTDEVVIIGSDAWIKKAGGGWRKTTRADSDVASAISLTSADPKFLQDQQLSGALASLDSQRETINGLDTRRYHIPKSALPSLTNLLGENFLKDAAGLTAFEMTVWLEDKTGALVRVDLNATATPRLLGQTPPFDIPPDATLTVTMLINLTQINDSGITIEPPI